MQRKKQSQGQNESKRQRVRVQKSKKLDVQSERKRQTGNENQEMSDAEKPTQGIAAAKPKSRASAKDPWHGIVKSVESEVNQRC